MSRPLRVAYLIASHGRPAQLQRLVATIRDESPQAVIVVHHDRFASPTPFAELSAVRDVIVIEAPERVCWGGFEMVEMWLRCFDALRSRDIAFDWVHLISAQDYPIRPIEEFERYLSNADVDGFLRAHPWNTWRAEENATRYFFQYRKLPKFRLHWRLRSAFNVLQPWVRLHSNRVGNFIGFRAKQTPFDDAMPCYYASFWMTLNTAAVDAIYRGFATRPGLADYYRRTLHADESCLQTILAADRSLRLNLKSKLHFVNWRPKGVQESPDVILKSDFPLIENSPAFFARKFELDADADVLDMVDARRMRLRQEAMESQSS